MRNVVTWFVLAMLATLVLALAAGMSPPFLRRLVLFPVVFGLLLGWGLSRLAVELSLTRPRLLPPVVAVLTVAGLVNVAYVSYGRLVDAVEQAVADDPQRLLALKMLQDAAADDPAANAQLPALRLQTRPAFSDYLAYRITSLGDWPPPWPAAFWIAELALAATGSFWIARRTARSR